MPRAQAICEDRKPETRDARLSSPSKMDFFRVGEVNGVVPDGVASFRRSESFSGRGRPAVGPHLRGDQNAQFFVEA
jgi:hypothetical protein